MDLAAVVARIDSRLAELGLSAATASRAAGLSPDAIRNMKRALKDGKNQGVSTKTLTALAPVLGTTASWLLDETEPAGAALEVKGPYPVKAKVPFAGVVQAGLFLSVDDYFQQDEFSDHVPASVARHPDYARLPQQAWLVRGDSMDEAGITEGMWVVAAPYIDYVDQVGELYNGQVVVVQRTRNGGSERERTIKEVQFSRAGMRLIPRSSNPFYREIFVPLDHDADPDKETVEVIAVVLSATRDLSRPPQR